MIATGVNELSAPPIVAIRRTVATLDVNVTVYREIVPRLTTVPGARARCHRKALSLRDKAGYLAVYSGRA
jgi:hypothetical protein